MIINSETDPSKALGPNIGTNNKETSRKEQN